MIDKTVFEQEIEAIKGLINQASKLKSNLALDIERIPQEVKTLYQSTSERDSNFLSYLDLLKKFQFSDQLTSPVDLFPAVRTAADIVDPEELTKNADAMKNMASKIELLHKKAEITSGSAINSLKRCIAEFCEYVQQENQIYDEALKLLQDADSIYDIGQIARNT